MVLVTILFVLRELGGPMVIFMYAAFFFSEVLDHLMGMLWDAPGAAPKGGGTQHDLTSRDVLIAELFRSIVQICAGCFLVW